MVVDLAPASIADEVVQNVQTILSTPKGSVPMDRAFGVQQIGLDMTLASAQASAAADYVTAIATYEPRAQVTGVSFVPDELNGRLTATVTFLVNGQVQVVTNG